MTDNIPKASLKDLRDFLLALPDDAPIEMETGFADGFGCLMTQYGRTRGWKFGYSSDLYAGWYKDLAACYVPNKRPVAVITENKSVFSLFREYVAELDGYTPERKFAKYWKDRLLPWEE